MDTASIFKAYDIRGIYPTEINEEIAYKIGRAFVVYLSAENIAIGRDARESSPALYEALVRGITDQGCNVIDLGVVSTPIVYYASGTLDVDGAISLTASHNPAEYNGMKLTHHEAVPIGQDSGLKQIKELVDKNAFSDSANKGVVAHHDSTQEYIDHFSSFAKLGKKKLKMVIDFANGMGLIEQPLFEILSKNIEIIPLFDTIDMSFPNHEANPLKTETLNDLRRKVIEEKADIGIAFDGDADRVGFVDEQGDVVPMDHITALLAESVLKTNPGSTILYDLRSTNAVREIIEENGGIAHECRVGHAYIKKQMRQEKALFAGELSGHYYFAENFTAESASFAVVLILNLLAQQDQPFSTLVQPIKRYFQSGEINNEVDDKDMVIDTLKKTYKDGTLSELDGIKITYPDWWFNVRASNTEPLLRLNLEAKTHKMLELKKAELLNIIQNG
jgi:phosphomannomutase